MPKTFKIYIPGEVVKQVEEYTFADGTTVTMDVVDKVLVPSKKNQQRMVVNKKTLKVMPIASKQHEKWQRTHLKIFRKYARDMEEKGFRLPLVRAKMTVLFYFPDSKGRDLSNKFETIADIMVDTGIIMDDKFQVLRPIKLDGFCNRAKPRTEIYLSIIDPKSEEYEWDITPKEYYEEKQLKKNLKRRIQSDKKRTSLKSKAITSIIDSLLFHKE